MYREKMDLRIKLATLPFCDFHFYFQDYISLIGSKRSSSDYKQYMDKDFMEQILISLNPTQHINQIDEISLLLEKFYPHKQMIEFTDSGKNPERFFIYRLKELSELFITHRNGKVALKYWESSEEKKNANSIFSAYRGIYKVTLWNSLNRMMCVDVLVMIYLLTNGMEEEYVLQAYHGLVYLPDTQLEKVLGKGVAETHLHLSASGQFNLNWQKMMSPEPQGLSLEVINKYTYMDKLTGKKEGLQLYTIAAAIMRLVMGAYLHFIQGSTSPSKQSFLSYMNSISHKFSGNAQPLNSLIRKIYDGSDLLNEGYDKKQLYQLYEDVRTSLSEVDFEIEEIPNWSARLAAHDSLSRIFGIGQHYTSLENLFMFRALRYILKQPEDSIFSKLFRQYILIKNEQFSRMIQSNYIRGLPYFSNYFAKATSVEVGNDDLHKYGFLLHHQLQSPNIKKLEIRIKPAEGSNVAVIKNGLVKKLVFIFTAFKQVLEEQQADQSSSIISEQYSGISAPQLGIIYHFIKQPDYSRIEKCWYDYSENERNNEKLSFKQIQVKYKQEMIAIREIREQITGLSEFIVGIDAANIETFVEPWVFAPIFRQARNSDTHQLIYRNSPKRSIKNLGLTFHVGEDFRHMLTGLRHLDEVIEHFQFRAGDRIGHGMVLGVEVEKWCNRNRVVILPRIEMLENLLWVWGMCRDGSPITNVDIAYLENKILQIAEKIYRSVNGITVYLLWSAYQNKFEEESGDTLSCIDVPTRNEWFCEQFNDEKRWTKQRLIGAYHCKCYLTNMQEPVEVEITREDELLIEQMQVIVLKKVSKDGIIIETNPTSNTAIGEIENIFEHYIHNLNRRGLSNELAVEKGVMVTINTDDPVVFNTNIDNEFAYIFYSLHEKGYAREDILQWIDHIRETGLNSSFIETKHISLKDQIIEINVLISCLKSYLNGGMGTVY
ncbi:hypothetical protein [Paenibacillus amylolyticus]|uniref:hypothetical protein n=1 Tax=Paenibacillus amylolyticus TaxID=1451 RepID=UPI00201E2618|nr:hypothetical protein [Paenibacillus amylolyticus]MCL6660899.1 hypothetical protein [Paenibacillus amylolyticus]